MTFQAPIVSKHVELACNDAEIFGLASDPYFADLANHSAQQDVLRRELEALPGGAVVIDIGANLGVTSILAGRIVPAATVIAVEAAPRAAECLRRTVEQNGFTGCTVIEKAIGAECRPARFVERPFLAGSSLSLADDEGAVVEMMTIDALVAELGLHHVDLIKLDIEGFEIDALRGATETIARFNPRFVMEWNPFVVMVRRRISPWLLLETILAQFGRFQTDIPGFENVASEAHALDFLAVGLPRAADVADICFGDVR